MIIKSLELSDYRNYEQVSIKFDKGINILYGDNAQGKTNILEAIYLFGTTKSHRGNKDKEIIHKYTQGKNKLSPYNTIIFNSALSLYIAKKAPSLPDALKLSKDTIDNGSAYEVFQKCQNII